MMPLYVKKIMMGKCPLFDTTFRLFYQKASSIWMTFPVWVQSTIGLQGILPRRLENPILVHSPENSHAKRDRGLV
jgi:hypothetical protein